MDGRHLKGSGLKARGLLRYVWVQWLLVSLVGLLGISYFYRGFFQSGFRLVQGNFFDGRLTLTINQHWSNPLQFGSFMDTGIFHPLSQGLMYSDTFLVHGLTSAPLIWLGLDASIAFQITLILISLVGFMTTVAFLRLVGSPWFVAIGAGLLVNFSNGMLVASDHPQLITLSLFPAVLLLLLLSALSRRALRQFLYSLTAGVLSGLILYSAFYVGWTLALGSALLLMISLVTLTRLQRISICRYFTRLRMSGFALGTVPFAILMLVTYLPLLQSGIVRELDDVSAFALTPKDLLGVSPTNLIWSLPLSHVLGTLRDEEYAMAPTPFLLLVGAVALGWALRRRTASPLIGVGIASTTVGFLLWLLPIKWGSVFPWVVVYQIPGASAIRAIGRVEIVANLFLVFGLALIATVVSRSHRGPRLLIVGAAITAVLLVEQINTRVEQRVEVDQVAELRNLPAPSIECRSFFIAPPLDTRRIYPYQSDPVIDAGISLGITAQIIARAQGIPSLNGYSGGEPPGWPLGPSTLIDYPIYEAELQRYVRDLALTDVCGLNLHDGTWFRYETPSR